MFLIVSYCFIYPPIFGVKDTIKRLNDPMQDNHVMVLTTEQCLKLVGCVNVVDEDFKNKLMKILEKYEQL